MSQVPVDRVRLDAIIALLEQTITIKQNYAKVLRQWPAESRSAAQVTAHDVTAQYVDINVIELQMLVNDLKSL